MGNFGWPGLGAHGAEKKLNAGILVKIKKKFQ